MSCSTPSGGLRKQIISQLCVLNINNTAQPLIKFFAKKNEISDTKTINHANEIVKKIFEHFIYFFGFVEFWAISRQKKQIFCC